MQGGPKVKIMEKGDMKTRLLNKTTISQKHQMLVCKFGLEDMMAACGYNNGKVKIFNLNTSSKIAEANTNKSINYETPVNILKWRPINQQSNMIGSAILVANTDGNIYQYVAKTGKQIAHIVQQTNYIMALDYAPDALSFATGGKDAIVRVYDQQTKKLKTQLKGVQWQKAGHTNRIFCVKYKPDDSNLLASGGWDQNIYVWDIREGLGVSTLNGPKILGDAIDFRDNLILSGAHRGTNQLQLWDWRKKQQLSAFRWDQQKQQTTAFLFSCQFVKSEKNLVVAVGANQMKIFSLLDYSQKAQIQFDKEQSLYTVDTSLSSHKYLVGGKKGNMFLINGLKAHN